MYMFRRRRTNLTNRLVKARKRGRNAGGGEPVRALLQRLQENQLGMLWTAVESRGREASGCVLLPRDRQPHVLCCQAWRWPELVEGAELRRLPGCRSANDTVYICCNPYHWSRIYQPDTPPPPYSRCSLNRLKPEDRAPSETDVPFRFLGSLTTSGNESCRNTAEWCKLAYWELTKRVGPLYPVESSAVNIFGDVPYGGDGLSLQTLAQQNCNASESVKRTRCKIGLGVTLSHEDGYVWVYNRSDNPIFVNSLTLEGADAPLPTRVPAEHCLCVFDPARAARLTADWRIDSPFGPVDPNSIRISFMKGWGPTYSRQDIASCPCWLEILLAPCR